MRYYRAYLLNRENGIIGVREFSLADDDAAIAAAKAIDHAFGISVWQQARKVCDIPPRA